MYWDYEKINLYDHLHLHRFCYSAKAQTNLQIFYDFGEDRQNVTTTLEGYYGDKWGDTFPVHTAAISRYSIGQHFGCDNLNVGGELEISCNFAGVHGWKCR